MNIPEKIDSILAQRKAILPQIEQALDNARHARDVVERLDRYRAARTNTPEVAAKLAAIDIRPFYTQQEKAVQQLEHLHNRFSREEIKICFVGRARQGKSLVLQRISGLESDVIPSSDGDHCTGTRSIISNRPAAETMAEIDFFTEQEYVKIVNSYLTEIYKKTAPQVSSVAEISKLDLLSLKERITFDQEILWGRLEKLVVHAAEFHGKFGTRLTIPKSEIESYVAQYKHDDDSKKYYTFLGVKQANILVEFPFAQCGKIVLVDTIGIGDVALGIEDEMIDTAKDSDAIIMMQRPDGIAAVVFKEEYETLTSIARAVSPEYTKKMLFWLLNRVEKEKGRNVELVPKVMKQIKERNLPIADCLDVNCWEQSDVEKNLLVPVLEQMSANLSSIDQLILERTNQQLLALADAYHIISSQIERAVGASVNQNERRHFAKDIEVLRDTMLNKIRDLYLELTEDQSGSGVRGEVRDVLCEPLRKAAKEKLRHIEANVPSEGDIMKWLNNGRINQHDALKILTDELRLQIINDFLTLNVPLHDIVLDMKRKVTQVLAIEGKLGGIVSADPDNPDEWLAALHSKLDPVDHHLIMDALDPLMKFDLRMENFLIYRVRRCLHYIDWSLLRTPPELSSGLTDKKNRLRKKLAVYYVADWQKYAEIFLSSWIISICSPTQLFSRRSMTFMTEPRSPLTKRA